MMCSLTIVRLSSCYSVAQSCPTLKPHGLQHVRLPCPSLSPGVCSDSCPLSRWCYPNILSFVVPFSSCLQSFPVSGSFSNEWILSIRWPKFWSSSFSMSLSNEYSGLISLQLTALISLQTKGYSRVFSNTTVWKCQFFGAQPSLWSTSHIHTWLLEKP